MRNVVQEWWLYHIFKEQFKRVAKKHRFRTAFRPGNKVRQVKAKAQKPLGEKRKAVVYEIPCKCDEGVMWERLGADLKLERKSL